MERNRQMRSYRPCYSKILETQWNGVMRVIVTLDGLTCILLLSPRTRAPEVEFGPDDGCMGPRWDD